MTDLTTAVDLTGYAHSNVSCNVDHGDASCPGWVPYDGVYPLREEGWLMAPDKPIDDLEDDAPDVPNDEVPSENDDDQAEKENPNG